MPADEQPGSLRVPHEVAYDADFEDSVMVTVLHPPRPLGIVVLDQGAKSPSPPTESVRRSDVDTASLPNFDVSELPLGLDHPARRYRSSVPGINLTHPGGLLEGGAGFGGESAAAEGERRELVEEILDEQGIRDAKSFWAAVVRERNEARKELEDRMRARHKAKRTNKEIERELDSLKEKRNLEVRVLERKMGRG